MGRAIKVIQNGRSTIMPNNPGNINRLNHYNHIQRNHKDASQLLYTILTDVTPEEEATIFPVLKRRDKAANQQGAYYNDRLGVLERENSELKSMMLNFLAGQSASPALPDKKESPKEGESTEGAEQGKPSEQPERKGPGRPPAPKKD